MRCTSPRTVGLQADGKTLAWSQKHRSKEYATFQLPCSKCLECRLEQASQKALRCIHEASLYERNSFVTLTYDEEHLKSPKLQLRDFQLFMKSLRSHIFRDVKKKFGKENWSLLDPKEKRAALEPFKIGVFYTGEYGEKNKRPHWHAIIFNWRPPDPKWKYTAHCGDEVYTSELLSSLWKNGACEFGAVNKNSAGYVARYSAKKLVHGPDGSHDFEPIHKSSSKNAIGKRWLEKFWSDVFLLGSVRTLEGNLPIPRYYEKWLQKNRPLDWQRYVTVVKQKKIAEASAKSEAEKIEEQLANIKRCYRKGHQRSRIESRRIILEQKHQMLLEKLKL